VFFAVKMNEARLGLGADRLENRFVMHLAMQTSCGLFAWSAAAPRERGFRQRVRFSFGSGMRGTERLRSDAQSGTLLLHNVDQFVRQQLHPFVGIRFIFAAAENDIAAQRIRPGSDPLSCQRRLVIGVQTHATEVMSEATFKLPANGARNGCSMLLSGPRG
jgi:hypothetical protein